jgi:hypothetical protein
VLVALTLLPASYAFDSATSACRQNPTYCASTMGEEAVVPTVQGGAELASISSTLRILTAATRSLIEEALVECAQQAHTEVNQARLGGRSPSREQCQEVMEVDACGRKVTRAMRLGTEKHTLAIQCARAKLEFLTPGSFSLEPRYRYDRQTGKKQLLSPEETREFLRKNCGDELVGTLVPDVVIHSGDPLRILAIYDFKFPCPISNEPRWNRYPQGHPYFGFNQGKVYEELSGIVPFRIAPVWKVQ